jgi:hypothetical protein
MIRDYGFTCFSGYCGEFTTNLDSHVGLQGSIRPRRPKIVRWNFVGYCQDMSKQSNIQLKVLCSLAFVLARLIHAKLTNLQRRLFARSCLSIWTRASIVDLFQPITEAHSPPDYFKIFLRAQQGTKDRDLQNKTISQPCDERLARKSISFCQAIMHLNTFLGLHRQFTELPIHPTASG